jgi:hypothetical protein
MCICNQIPFPHLREACIVLAKAVRDERNGDRSDRKVGAFDGGGFRGGGAGGCYLRLNPYGESPISELDVHHR